MLGLVVGVWGGIVVSPISVEVGGLLVLPFLFFGWYICTGLGGLLALKFGVNAVYGTWFGGLSSLVVSLLLVKDHGPFDPWSFLYMDAFILLCLFTGMVVGAAVGARCSRFGKR